MIRRCRRLPFIGSDAGEIAMADQHGVRHIPRAADSTGLRHPAATYTDHYLASRLDPNSAFGYGLRRRTEMLLSCIDRFSPSTPRSSFDVVDFGCADGAMLGAAAAHLGAAMRSGTGLDVFRSGLPASLDQAGRMDFVRVDLFKEFPYPLASTSQDIAIVSAFLKHHPAPRRFLDEVARILRTGGIAIVLDPRPIVVRVGMVFGRFNPLYNPSPWNRRTVTKLLDERPEPGLVIEHFQRYWLAPNQASLRIGVERCLPDAVIRACGLHQCLVLRKA